MRIIALLLATAGMCACASSGTVAEGDGASADASQGPQTKTVCRREKTTGSRTKGERICKEVPVD